MNKSVFYLILICHMLVWPADGQNHTYHPDGTIKELVTQDGDQKRIRTYGIDGSLLSDAYLLNGEYDGIVKKYYDTGELKSVAHFKNGLQTGEYLEYFVNGELWQKLNYDIIEEGGLHRSVLQDSAWYYSYDGYLYAKGMYVDGKKEGLWKHWVRGKIRETKYYQDGLVHGLHIEYYDNGQMRRSRLFFEKLTIDGQTYHNVIQGADVYYYENGNKERLKCYDLGVPTGEERRWHYDGNIFQKADVINEHRRLFRVFEIEGWLSHEGEQVSKTNQHVKYWVPDGVQRKWEKGNLVEVRNFDNGQEDGHYTAYYTNGIIKASGYCIRARYIGPFEEYWPNGQLKRKGSTVFDGFDYNGKPEVLYDGVFRKWNEQGVLTSEVLYEKSKNSLYRITYNDSGRVNLRQINYLGLDWEVKYYGNGDVSYEDFSIGNYFMRYQFHRNGNLKAFAKHTQDLNDNLSLQFDLNGQLFHGRRGDKMLKSIDSSVYVPYLYQYRGNNFYEKVEDGPFEINYINGSPRLKGHISNNLPYGDMYLFYPSGETLLKLQFDTITNALLMHGFQKNGDTVYKINVINGKTREFYIKRRDGYEKRLRKDSADNTLYLFETYAGGQPKNLEDKERGIQKSWREDGSLKNETFPVDSLNEHSQTYSYFPDGSLYQTSFSKDGKKHGQHKEYYQNGQLRFKGHYHKGILQGESELYFEDGRLREKGSWENGKREGEWLLYRNDSLHKVVFHDNLAEVPEPDGKCDCFETSLPEARLKGPMYIRGVVEYSELREEVPGFTDLLDSGTYNNKLLQGHYHHFGVEQGNLQMASLAYIDLRLSKEAYPILRLNRCYTPGYYSEFNFNYRREGWWRRKNSGWLESPHLQLMMKSSFLQQKGDQDIKISSSPEELHFKEPENLYVEGDDLCFEDISAGAWVLQHGGGNLVLNSRPMPFFKGNEYSVQPRDLKFAPELVLLKKINGMHLYWAEGYLLMDEKQIPWRATNLWVSDTWTGGTMVIQYHNRKGDEFNVLTDGEEVHRTSRAELLELLKNAGFKSDINFDKSNHQVLVEFFGKE